MARRELITAALCLLLIPSLTVADGEDKLPAFWADDAFASSEYSRTSWSAKQATGAPDTPKAGDHPTAWASRSGDGGEQWLELLYAMPLIPVRVGVVESCSPGFVTRIQAWDYQGSPMLKGKLPEGSAGRWVTLWEGFDDTTQCPAEFAPPLKTVDFPTNRIRITANTNVPGWNEIDAVSLSGRPVGMRSVGTRQWANRAVASSQYSSAGWSAMQASGPPDTHRDGDHSSAWAPAVRNGGLEWIELTYGLRVVPTQVCIRETYNPGFVTKVEADDAGTWRELWSGHDPTAESPGIFSPPLSGNTFATTRIRITIDTSVPGWNEIDAVELVGSVR